MIKILILDIIEPYRATRKTLQVDEEYYIQDEFDEHLEKYVQMLAERKEQDQEKKKKSFYPGKKVLYKDDHTLLQAIIISKLNGDEDNRYLIAIPIDNTIGTKYVSIDKLTLITKNS